VGDVADNPQRRVSRGARRERDGGLYTALQAVLAMISAGFAELVWPNGHACIYPSEVSRGLSFAEEERGGAGLGRLGMMHWGRHSVTQA